MVQKSIDVIYYINRMKDGNHMIIAIHTHTHTHTHTHKAFDRIQYPFTIRTLKVNIKGMYLNIIKTILTSPQLISYLTVKG